MLVGMETKYAVCAQHQTPTIPPIVTILPTLCIKGSRSTLALLALAPNPQ